MKKTTLLLTALIVGYSLALPAAQVDYLKKGNEERDEGDLKSAIADYSKAIEEDATNAEAYEERGNAKDNLGDATGAMADYDRAIALKPNEADYYYNRGLAKQHKKDFDGA